MQLALAAPDMQLDRLTGTIYQHKHRMESSRSTAAQCVGQRKVRNL